MKILPAERKRKIVKKVTEKGAVTTSELSKLFSVSLITIRNDLQELAQKGFLVRTHGGAVSKSTTSSESPHQEKELRHTKEKKRIGEKAASLIKTKSTILLGAGTTTLQMVPYLGNKDRVTILTNSLDIAFALSRVPSIEIAVIGGTLRRVSYAMVGPAAERYFDDIFVDQLFMGVHSISLDHGLTEPNLAEAKVYKLMLRIAHQKIVLVDHSKFGTFAHAKIADLHDVDIIVSDNKLEKSYEEAIADQGVKVITV